MNELRLDHHLIFDGPITLNLQGNEQGQPAWVDKIVAQMNQLQEQGVSIMATMQQVLDDLDTIKTQTGAYIAGRDAIDVTLNQTIADLTAQLAAGKTTLDQFQADTDTAFQKAEDDKALLAVPSTTPAPTTLRK